MSNKANTRVNQITHAPPRAPMEFEAKYSLQDNIPLPDDPVIIDGWYRRLDQWCKKDELPNACAPIVYKPDNPSNQALHRLAKTFQTNVQLVIDAYTACDQVVTQLQFSSIFLTQIESHLAEQLTDEVAKEIMAGYREKHEEQLIEKLAEEMFWLRKELKTFLGVINPKPTGRELEFLQALMELDAFSEDNRKSTAKIVRRIDKSADWNSWGKVRISLRNRGLIKVTRGGGSGCWLTDYGSNLIEDQKDI